jgi:hypothetical protein
VLLHQPSSEPELRRLAVLAVATPLLLAHQTADPQPHRVTVTL